MLEKVKPRSKLRAAKTRRDLSFSFQAPTLKNNDMRHIYSKIKRGTNNLIERRPVYNN